MSEPQMDLVKLESPDQVAAGDTVYEVVRHNSGEHGVKYNPYLVQHVERKACTVRRVGSKDMEIKLHFKQLMIERKNDAPTRPGKPSPDPESPGEPAAQLDSVSAWLSMGADVIRGLEDEARGLVDERALLVEQISEAGSVHRDRICALEAQLREARSEQGRVQAQHSATLKNIDKKIEALAERRAQLERLITAAQGGRSGS